MTLKKLLLLCGIAAFAISANQTLAEDAGKEPQADDMKAFVFLSLADSDWDFYYKVPPNQLFIGTTDKVYRGEKFMVMPFATGLVKNDGDSFKANYKVSLKNLSTGDIKTILENSTEDKLPNKYWLYPIPATIILNFDDSDDLGKYELIFEIENETEGTRAASAAQVELAEWTKPAEIASPKELDDLFMAYNQLNRPEDLYAIFTNKNNSLRQKGSLVNYSTYSFFVNGFDRHRFLLNILANELEGMSGESRFNTLIILTALNSADLAKGASETELAMAKEFADYAEENKIGASLLDYWWGEFFATGKFEPVKNLIETIKTRRPEIDKFVKKLSGEEVEMTEEEVMDGTEGILAGWSMRANLNRNKLLEKFFTLAMMNMGESEAKEIMDAIDKSQKAIDRANTQNNQ